MLPFFAIRRCVHGSSTGAGRGAGVCDVYEAANASRAHRIASTLRSTVRAHSSWHSASSASASARAKRPMSASVLKTCREDVVRDAQRILDERRASLAVGEQLDDHAVRRRQPRLDGAVGGARARDREREQRRVDSGAGRRREERDAPLGPQRSPAQAHPVELGVVRGEPRQAAERAHKLERVAQARERLERRGAGAGGVRLHATLEVRRRDVRPRRVPHVKQPGAGRGEQPLVRRDSVRVFTPLASSCTSMLPGACAQSAARGRGESGRLWHAKVPATYGPPLCVARLVCVA
eukprot:7384564-Prymnesium_polylepis.1